jgi:hypothetical protein
MSFDGALSHVEIPSDLRVVTSLEQQLDNLLFPGSYLGNLFFDCHLHLTEMYAGVDASGAKSQAPRRIWIQSLRLILQTAGQNGPFLLNTGKILPTRVFAGKFPV